MRKTKAPAGPTPPGKKARKQDGEPSLSRLTARQLAVARLVSSYKYECKKVFHALEEAQRRWASEIDVRRQRQSIHPDTTHQSTLASDRLQRSESQQRNLALTAELGEPWKQSEREVLKRCFLSFGFGRWREIESTVRRMQKLNRHSMKEMECACWDLISKLEHYVEGKEKEYLKQKLDAVSSKMPFQSPGVPWAKFQTSARIWARRLQLLDNIRLLKHQMRYPSLKAFFKSSLGAMSDTNPPTSWWCPDADLLLICGAYTYGYGNYDELRSDPHFCQIYKNSCFDLGQTPSTSDLHGGAFAIADWPATDLLTKRLKRVTDNLIKTQQKNKNRSMMPDLSEEKMNWSTDQKLEIVQNLMAFGLPPPLTKSNQELIQKEWLKLFQTTNLKDLTLNQGQALCNEVLAETETILMQRPQEKDIDQDMEEAMKDISAEIAPNDALPEDQDLETLKRDSAVRLRGKLHFLKMLKSQMHLFKDPAFVKRVKSKCQGVPEWWVGGIHDHELVIGVNVHGFGAWSKVLKDDSYSFSKCHFIYKKNQKTIADYFPSLTEALSPTVAAQKIADDLELTVTPEEDFKTLYSESTWIVQRLRMLCVLMKDNSTLNNLAAKAHTNLRGQIEQIPSSLVQDSVESLAFPIEVSPCLSILALGTIEHERSSFHVGKLIYPIGYQSRRRIECRTFLCEVLDGGTNPLFQASADIDTNICFKSETLVDVWKMVTSKFPEAKHLNSGEEFFGLSYAPVMNLIYSLPNASKCIHGLGEGAHNSQKTTLAPPPITSLPSSGGLLLNRNVASDGVPVWLSRLSGAVNKPAHSFSRPLHNIPYHDVGARPGSRPPIQHKAVFLSNSSQGMQSWTSVQQLQQALRPVSSVWSPKPSIPVPLKDASASHGAAHPCRPPIRTSPSPQIQISKSGMSSDTQKWSSVFHGAGNLGEGATSLVSSFTIMPPKTSPLAPNPSASSANDQECVARSSEPDQTSSIE